MFGQDTAILLYVDRKSSATAYSITPFKALIGAIIRQNDKLLKIVLNCNFNHQTLKKVEVRSRPRFLPLVISIALEQLSETLL